MQQILILIFNWIKDQREKISKEKENIISDLENLIFKIPQGKVNECEFKWREDFLINKLNPYLKDKIKNLTEKFYKFRYLHSQLIENLENEIFSEIKKYCKQKEDLPEFQEILKRCSQLCRPESGVRNYYCSWQIGGKNVVKSLFEFLILDKSLTEFIEESKKDPNLPNQEISKLRCVIADIEIKKENWDEIISSLKKKLKKDKKYAEYFKNASEICNEAAQLKEKIKNVKPSLILLILKKFLIKKK